MQRLIIICLVFTFFNIYCFGQEIKFTSCNDDDPKDYCKINEVKILPCKEANTNKACNLKKGKTYEILMKFDALKPFEKMRSLPYWASGAGDIPFAGMKEDACEFTQCPVAEGSSQVYDFQLKIQKNLPRGQFDVKWKFFVDDNNKNGCCARFYLKLT